MSKNFLGIDYGSKRIGLAVASTESMLSSPLMTVENNDGVWDRFASIIRDENITEIVVGLPRNLEGDATAQTGKAIEFARMLRVKLKLPVHMQDEAATSQLATEILRQHTRRPQKPDIDTRAAAIILQDYLDNL